MDLPTSVNFSDVKAALTRLMPGFEADLTTDVYIGVDHIDVTHFRRYDDGQVERRVKSVTQIHINKGD